MRRHVRWPLGALTVGAVVVILALSAAMLTASPSRAQAAKARWTLLYYVAADNDREGERLEHVEKMAKAGSTEDVNVIVLIDRSPNDNTHVYGPNDIVEDGPLLNVGDFHDAKLLKVEKDKLTVLEELGEIDMGSPQTLAWFLATGFKEYPAEHYAAVIDDHGGGLVGAAWDDSTPDDGTGDGSYLSMPDITRALDAAFKATSVKRLDLFGFDACLMGNVDTALKLAPYADYLVASEEMTTGRQWNDTAVIRTAIDDPDATGADLGMAVAENQGAADFWDQRTMSVIDLRKLSGVKQALASFSRAVVDAGLESLAHLGRARNRSLHFGFLSAERDFALYDIGDMMAHLKGVPAAVTTAANALHAAVEQATVAVVSGEMSEAATGLSIIFPSSADDFPLEYEGFAAVPEWAALLDAYLGTGPEPPGPAPKFESPNVKLSLRPDGVVATADLVVGTDAGVVAADMLGGVVRADGSTQFLLQLGADIGAGKPNRIGAGWDYSYFQLSDSNGTALDATTFLTPVPAGVRCTIPLLYEDANGQQFHGALQFTMSNGNYTDFSLFGTAASGATTDLFPSEGSVIAPLVYTVKPGAPVTGEVTLTLAGDKSIDATKLGLIATSLSEGATYVVALVAHDTTGRAAVASGAGPVPAD